MKVCTSQEKSTQNVWCLLVLIIGENACEKPDISNGKTKMSFSIFGMDNQISQTLSHSDEILVQLFGW